MHITIDVTISDNGMTWKAPSGSARADIDIDNFSPEIITRELVRQLALDAAKKYETEKAQEEIGE